MSRPGPGFGPGPAPGYGPGPGPVFFPGPGPEKWWGQARVFGGVKPFLAKKLLPFSCEFAERLIDLSKRR